MSRISLRVEENCHSKDVFTYKDKFQIVKIKRFLNIQYQSLPLHLSK